MEWDACFRLYVGFWIILPHHLSPLGVHPTCGEPVYNKAVEERNKPNSRPSIRMFLGVGSDEWESNVIGYGHGGLLSDLHIVSACFSP
jgi:hypothetical protein